MQHRKRLLAEFYREEELLTDTNCVRLFLEHVLSNHSTCKRLMRLSAELSAFVA